MRSLCRIVYRTVPWRQKRGLRLRVLPQREPAYAPVAPRLLLFLSRREQKKGKGHCPSSFTTAALARRDREGICMHASTDRSRRGFLQQLVAASMGLAALPR